MDIQYVVNEVNKKLGTNYSLLKRFGKGEQGAYLVKDPFNKRYILKWADEGSSDLRQAVHYTQLLKKQGILYLYIHI